MFYGRQEELRFLKGKYHSNQSEFIQLYYLNVKPLDYSVIKNILI